MPLRMTSHFSARQAAANQLVCEFDSTPRPRTAGGVSSHLSSGIVNAAFARAVAGPAVCGRHHRGAVETPQEPHQEIGLVIVRVDDVDAPFADDAAQRRQDRHVERMLLRDLEVLDAEAGGALVDPEHRVANVADVADRDVPRCRVRLGGAEQNRLLRATAGPADAAQLENANRVAHALVPEGRPEREAVWRTRCGVRTTSASAREMS